MMILKWFCKQIFLFTVLSLCCHVLHADTQSDIKIKVLLKEIAPNKNSDLILNLTNKISPNVKKINFPANDYALRYLSDYTFDAVKNEDFEKSLKKIIVGLPKNIYLKNQWLTHLQDSTAVPTEYLSTPHEKVVSLHACVPHDCTTNVSLLYNPNTKVIWGVLRQDTGRTYLLGNPSNEQLAVLLVVISKE